MGTPRELWILVREDGSMVQGYAEETEAEMWTRARRDWKERVLGPFVLSTPSASPVAEETAS